MTRKPYNLHYYIFDRLAPLYDLGIWLLMLFAGGEDKLRGRVIREAFPLEDVRVLEIFAGTATLSLAAAKKGAEATAVDLSAGMLSVALEKSRRSGDHIDVVRADAAGLPFYGEAFERVIVSLGLHETQMGAVPVILSEVFRVLKPGGRLVIFDYYGADGLAGFIEGLFFAFAEGENARGWIKLDIQGLLKNVGFRRFNRTFLMKRVFQVLTVEKG